MPAKDVFHDLVKVALQKDGWTITHDPYHIDLGFVDLYIDLGAEKLIAATKDNNKIAVEIKTFIASSTITEFHSAIGQYVNYRLALEENDAERLLYLAVPMEIHKLTRAFLCGLQIPQGRSSSFKIYLFRRLSIATRYRY